jgi:hypothetical protein
MSASPDVAKAGAGYRDEPRLSGQRHLTINTTEGKATVALGDVYHTP